MLSLARVVSVRVLGSFVSRRFMGGMMLMELLGAIGPLEFMALAGNPEQGNSHKKDREKFHRAASIATRGRNATPKEQEIPARPSSSVQESARLME